MEIIIDIVIALGTIAVVIIAVYGSWLKAKFAGPKLELAILSENGELTANQKGEKLRYFHLQVKNKRHWAPAENVRIMLSKILKQTPNDSKFLPYPMIKYQLSWAPAFWHEITPTIHTDDQCDFGFISQVHQDFRLALYVYPNDFPGYINAGETMRVGLLIEADNYSSGKIFWYEIYWDGAWPDKDTDVPDHLRIVSIET